MSSLLVVSLAASVAALLYGIGRYLWRTWLVRHAEVAAAYRRAQQEAAALLARYGHRIRGGGHRFELAPVPIELRRSLLDGLQILAAHTQAPLDDEDALRSPAGELAELESALDMVRPIAEDRVPEVGRRALRALFVDTVHHELAQSLRGYRPGTHLDTGQRAELEAHLLPAAREALGWQLDGLAVSRSELRARLGEAEKILKMGILPDPSGTKSDAAEPEP